jgi:hypothetical protein
MSKEQEYRNLTHRLYNILMEYWNYIPEEEREAVDKKLKALGL